MMSKAAALCLSLGLALALASGPALAQGETAAAPREAQAAEPRKTGATNWIYTETVSPLDYAPVAIASAWSSEPDGPVVQLSIHCRRGRTDLVITSPAMTGRPEEQRLTYSVDDGPPVSLPAGAAASAGGLAIKDDVVRFLTALPATGEIAFQVAGPAAPLQGRYALGPLKAVLDRLAAPCKWPTNPPR
jgi:hypothetical protein